MKMIFSYWNTEILKKKHFLDTQGQMYAQKSTFPTFSHFFRIWMIRWKHIEKLSLEMKNKKCRIK